MAGPQNAILYHSMAVVTAAATIAVAGCELGEEQNFDGNGRIGLWDFSLLSQNFGATSRQLLRLALAPSAAFAVLTPQTHKNP